MKFDIVVGNPPYNNDIYIPFVELAHKITTDCVVAITPAKWQAKGGKDNERFRQNIVPYMSKIVYYPDCGDVFNIHLLGGTSYYVVDKEKHNEKQITNVASLQSIFNTINTRDFHNLTLFNNIDILIDKIKCSSNFFNTYISKSGKYKCIVCHMVNTNAGSSNFHTFNNKGQLLGISTVAIDEKMPSSNNYISIYENDSRDCCESFKSYIDTRFVRFLVWISTVASSLRNEETWRFVPDPGAFDHIFTDEELYKKYNLTQEEINIIESVIKERK